MNGDERPDWEGSPRLTETAGARVSTLSAKRSALQTLTNREREVLRVLAAGESNRVLSRRLGIAERTVKAHLTSITRKLGLRSRVEAVLLSMQWTDDLLPERPDGDGR
ncbi:response regulator transcription factor [Streptomyces smyrnaeus]|uniref:response regulator transcription factor n=1 Tax=Streptomyces TaxID=1883 RepID=UPI000C1A6D23|nr:MULTISPECIES: LuxR C-terminal-related transcriptional regulator [unclassified Streptomyces]MBQ0863688.1 response regulator transcription factor [Streptomyces sp. RK75]MBQ1123787.1 response regulator transcription factor [Streptomyces sp. B15]MBQ1162424.1 response regulator transcription factor [Streptomyces sp. A73]